MSKLVLKHILHSLKANNLIAYEYSHSDKTYNWLGDLDHFLGMSSDQYPARQDDFEKIINPQDQAQRLSWFHDVLDQCEKDSADDVLAHSECIYKIRHIDGAFLDVRETIEIHVNEDEKGSRDEIVLTGTIEFLDETQIKASSVKVKQEIDKGEQIIAVQPQLQSSEQGRRNTKYTIARWLDEQGGHKAASKGFCLIVGIDRLSLYNEFIGMNHTDEIIEQTGKRLSSLFAGKADIHRIAGDVYSVLMKYEQGSDMSTMASFILQSFYEDPIMTSTGPLLVGVSIGGVVITNENDWDASSFITKGELAMQTAKEQGRGRFVPYNSAAIYAAKQHSTLELGTRFLHALKEGQLHLAFQPIVNSQTSGVKFHECLLRMLDDNGRMVSAGEFIPAIEKLGMAPFLDQYTIRLAIQELMMFPELELSVNVSRLNLVHEDWLRGIVAMLRECPQVAARLIIEITETALCETDERVTNVVKALKDLGCRIALDDFGAGYTSFSQIQDMYVDYVKIDKSFIRNLGSGRNDAFVRTLNTLAQSVDVQTVAEGAETMAEAKLLKDEGLDYIQGYAYGFPEVERVWLPEDHVYRKIVTQDSSGQNKIEHPTRSQSQMLDELRQLYQN